MKFLVACGLGFVAGVFVATILWALLVLPVCFVLNGDSGPEWLARAMWGIGGIGGAVYGLILAARDNAAEQTQSDD